MKYDALWWKAFWSWFGGMAMFYGGIIVPLDMLLFWNRGPVFEPRTLAVGIPILIVFATGLSAWAAVEGYCAPSKNHRGWVLRIATKHGLRLMRYFNPFWLVYALLVLVLWEKAFVPFGEWLGWWIRMLICLAVSGDKK